MKLIHSGKKLDWESQELVNLRLVQQLLVSIYGETELDLDHVNNESLKNLLGKVSNKVETINRIIQTELNRLIKRDSNIDKDYVCSHCQSDNIWVCEPCMIKWSDSIKPVEIK